MRGCSLCLRGWCIKSSMWRSKDDTGAHSCQLSRDLPVQVQVPPMGSPMAMQTGGPQISHADHTAAQEQV